MTTAADSVPTLLLLIMLLLLIPAAEKEQEQDQEQELGLRFALATTRQSREIRKRTQNLSACLQSLAMPDRRSACREFLKSALKATEPGEAVMDCGQP